MGITEKNGRLMSNGLVMYGYDNIVLDAFPYLKETIDGASLFF